MSRYRFCLAVVAVVFGAWSSVCAAALPAIEKAEVSAPVTVADEDRSWTLDNGIVKATISKNNGNMTALLYHGINTMNGGGYWEQTPANSRQLTQTVTIDPSKNGGARAEVAVKGVTGGGRFDMEVRYALGAERAAFMRMRFSRIRRSMGAWAPARADISRS